MMEAVIGQHVSELDTPALCIDLDVMERNIQLMSDEIRQYGKQWRPHIKCHKSSLIAAEQLTTGAIGVTSAKVSEAEVFVNAGISDVLIANMIIGERKLTRIAKMCEIGDPIVACDHFAQAEALSNICLKLGVTCRVIIEIDLGLHRVGIRPGPDAVRLAQGIDKLPGVNLVGVMGYEGHLLTESDQSHKHERIMTAMSLLEELRDRMRRDGICCDIVSAGGTGSYQITAQHPAITELQCGGGIFGDPFYTEQCGVQGLSPAITLIATVSSRPSLERAVLDVGRKSLHPDIHPPSLLHNVQGRPLLDAKVTHLSAEHLTLELGPESQSLIIGDKVEMIPGYTDHTTVLHDQFYGVRDRIVESIIPIPARGKLQ